MIAHRNQWLAGIFDIRNEGDGTYSWFVVAYGVELEGTAGSFMAARKSIRRAVRDRFGWLRYLRVWPQLP